MWLPSPRHGAESRQVDVHVGLTGPARRHESPAPTSQQRITQNWLKMSRPSGATAGTAHWAQPGGNSGAPNEVGRADQPDRGDMGGQLTGRSRVIHMLWNGFLSVGLEPGPRPWPGRLIVWAASGRAWSACFCTLWVSWVHAAGSGSSPAANCGRREDPAINAMNRLSAVTIATIDCRRRVMTARSRPTVAALYNIILVR